MRRTLALRDRVWIVAALAGTVLAGWMADPAVAQEGAADPAPTRQVGAALSAAQNTHLWRVAWWGGANLALGLGLVAAGDRSAHPTRFGFGVQTAAWGAINLGIAAWGLLSGPEAPGPGLAERLAAEDRWAHILLVNLGLNVGYMAVGTALEIAARRGLRSGPAVQGHARAVIVQGLGLMILDGLAYASSRGRLDGLLDEVAQRGVSLAPAVMGDGALGLVASLPLSF